jgi:tRNA-2-methylthio-N6-dimethylallyladenosine synthase
VEAVERGAIRQHQRRIGRTEEVLVEGPSKKDANVLTSRTRQNKILHFLPLPGRDPSVGTYGMVEVTGAAPHYLSGEWIETTREPPRRIRIPIAVAGS